METIDVYDKSELDDIKPNKRYIMHINFTIGMFEEAAKKLKGTKGSTFVTSNGIEIRTHIN